ncbi:MAG TPA: hypothetical protein VI731_06955, partial [Bacteroidia bacterium]|nr:hypothetical protein [Bacteroidia bacterium]
KYKDHAYQLFSDRPPSGSLMEADFLEPRFSSILKALPGAFYRTLFRPYLWEAKKPLFIFPALENIFFILIVILIFIYPQTPSHASLFGFCLVFSILLIAVAGLTTPVLGALVRYRSLALPFLFLGLLMLLDLNKLMSRLQKGKTVSGG